MQALFEDSKGRLWIGTVSGGLDLFDRETETFTHIKHQEGNAAPLSPGPVRCISEDSYGNIWVQVSNKLEKITLDRNEKARSTSISIHHTKLPFQSGAFFDTHSGQVAYVAAENLGVSLNLIAHIQHFY